MHSRFTKAIAIAAAYALTLVPVVPASADRDRDDFPSNTPIKHVVVVFQENVSFDHYFGTYPHAANLPGELDFRAKRDTPTVNGLESAGLLTGNPNGVNPVRIPPSIPVTCDEDHNYRDEQWAFHGGLMDRFTTPVPNQDPSKAASPFSCNDANLGPNSVMDYYDGNTVTALWNYAQNFAMSDNSFGTTFGPSTPGALNLAAGNTFGGVLVPTKPNGTAASGVGNLAGGGTAGSVIGDARPGLDDCSFTTAGLQGATLVTVNGKNIGDLLNARGLTWGWFQGGFAPTGTDNKGRAICGQHHSGLAGDDAVTQSSNGDYIPHHEPFQYFAQTANPHHLPPGSPTTIGQTDQANHQYDLADFFAALKIGRLPAVSFIKAPAYQDGHAGYSDPIDEQFFLVNLVNKLMESNEWQETAIIISYDDSDGWYDHVMGPIATQSNESSIAGHPTFLGDDFLFGAGNCGAPTSTQPGGTGQNGRCGYGPRLPLLVISPWARRNFVDHTVTDQSSIIRFIEDNFGLGRIGGGSADAIAGSLFGMFDFSKPRAGRVILDPNTGTVVRADFD
ncbi:MAG TPA: alkaline phosphatase family protein [Methylomirabilota bacterium]|nr:alkaline phosphatase family protein [Methylomirabilota bacterium]